VGKVKVNVPSRAAIEESWQRQATAAATESARKVIGGAVPAGTPVGKLNDFELGWLVSAGICAWISKRAQQACSEGFELLRTEEFIRETGATPRPWDAGAVAAILPELADVPGIDWNLRLNEWSRDTTIKFLCAAFELMQRAMAARDAAENPIARPAPVLGDAVGI
jgi:hypothetical protein